MAAPSTPRGFGGSDAEGEPPKATSKPGSTKQAPQKQPLQPSKPTSHQQAPRPRSAIPDHVANRMVRRIALLSGGPTLLAMGVFVLSYLLVSQGTMRIEPIVTITVSGVFFVLGLFGLSYAVLSASWENAPGSLLGLEQFGKNLQRVRTSLGTMKGRS